MNEIYDVLYDPDLGEWCAINELGITVWHDHDKAFIRRFARDPAYRWRIVEDCIKAEELTRRLAKSR